MKRLKSNHCFVCGRNDGRTIFVSIMQQWSYAYTYDYHPECIKILGGLPASTPWAIPYQIWKEHAGEEYLLDNDWIFDYGDRIKVMRKSNMHSLLGPAYIDLKHPRKNKYFLFGIPYTKKAWLKEVPKLQKNIY